MSIAIEKYTVNPDLRNMVDLLQRELECCGSLTIDDWDSNEYFSCKNVAGAYFLCLLLTPKGSRVEILITLKYFSVIG